MKQQTREQISFKISDGNIKRRVSLDNSDQLYEELLNLIRRWFPVPVTGEVALSYKDPQDDEIRVSTQIELREAISLSGGNFLALNLAVSCPANKMDSGSEAGSRSPSPERVPTDRGPFPFEEEKNEEMNKTTARLVQGNYARELKILKDRGFDKVPVNIRLLRKFEGDVDRVTAHLQVRRRQKLDKMEKKKKQGNDEMEHVGNQGRRKGQQRRQRKREPSQYKPAVVGSNSWNREEIPEYTSNRPHYSAGVFDPSFGGGDWGVYQQQHVMYAPPPSYYCSTPAVLGSKKLQPPPGLDGIRSHVVPGHEVSLRHSHIVEEQQQVAPPSRYLQTTAAMTRSGKEYNCAREMEHEKNKGKRGNMTAHELYLMTYGS